MQKNIDLAQKWDAVIIGSGIGGLACAAALSKKGWKTLVLEQHYVAGGCTHMFSRKGYQWDVGVHCLGQMGEKDVPWKLISWLSDEKIHMQSLGENYDILRLPEYPQVTFPNSRKAFKEKLHELFPQESVAINAYFAAVAKASNAMKFYFASRVLPRWAKPLEKLIEKIWGERFWMKTTDEVLNAITTNEKLKTVLTSQWGYYGATPKTSSFGVHAVTIEHFIEGGYYPVGGAKVFADELVKTIERQGGAVATRKTVSEVLVEKNKAIGVKLSTGETILCPVVVSGIGARATAEKLVPEKFRNQKWVKEIQSLKQSHCYLSLYLGFEGDIANAGATLANQWHFESWNMEDALWDIDDQSAIPPFIYVSFPSLKDPHHVPGPDQKHTGEVVTFVPWDSFQQWSHTRRGYREKEYTEFKKGLETRLLARFYEKFPGLKGMVKHCELSTPLSTQHFIQAPQGAIYGLDPTVARYKSRALKTRTPINGFYLTGCDVAALGVAGALTAGVLTAGTLESSILKRLL